jgi:hypothetical protein
MPRSFVNAFYDDERGSPVPGSSLFLNKFSEPGCPGVNFNDSLKNFLDPSARPQQRQKQAIPPAFQGQKSRYDLYVGSKVKKRIEEARRARTTPPELKISLLFGAGREHTAQDPAVMDLDNLGLRYYFEHVDDRVLINISGREPDDQVVPRRPRWNVGISGLVDARRGVDVDQVKGLMTGAGLADVPYKIAILAAYSTGYGGLNQTVNEGLIPLKDIERAVYYDCTYRADNPSPAADDTPVKLSAAENNSGPDEVDARGLAGSAFNTRRAITRIASATGKKDPGIAYMATKGGSPMYLRSHLYTVDFPTRVDFRAIPPGYPVAFEQALYALILSRWLAFAQVDGQVSSTEVPPPFKELAKALPQRGQVASTLATLKAKAGFSPTTTLLDWAKINQPQVTAAMAKRDAAIGLISDRKLVYSSGYPDRTNPGGALHAALLPEFGWEYIL